MNLGTHNYQIVATEGYYSSGSATVTVSEGSGQQTSQQQTSQQQTSQQQTSQQQTRTHPIVCPPMGTMRRSGMGRANVLPERFMPKLWSVVLAVPVSGDPIVLLTLVVYPRLNLILLIQVTMTRAARRLKLSVRAPECASESHRDENCL